MEKNNFQSNTDFYTPTGIHVYFKDSLSDGVDIEKVVAKLESKIPRHLLEEIEMIIVGQFDEFVERSINAFYDSGTIYVSNTQDNDQDLYDDLIHEVAHSIESPHGYYLYGDEKIKKEFLAKRNRLHDILWNMGFKTPKSFFREIEFNQEFDDFLYKKVGYDKLSQVLQGLFINAYAATSLREYFATAFTEFYLDTNHNFLKSVSPEVYKKINNAQKESSLDDVG